MWNQNFKMFSDITENYISASIIKFDIHKYLITMKNNLWISFYDLKCLMGTQWWLRNHNQVGLKGATHSKFQKPNWKISFKFFPQVMVDIGLFEGLRYVCSWLGLKRILKWPCIGVISPAWDTFNCLNNPCSFSNLNL